MFYDDSYLYKRQIESLFLLFFRLLKSNKIFLNIYRVDIKKTYTRNNNICKVNY